MVFHCRCFSFSFSFQEEEEEEEEEDIEFETAIQIQSILTPTFYTASSNFNPSVTDSLVFSRNLRVFTLAELKAATANFCTASKLGEGGFGNVFRGAITSFEHPFHDIQVAVKRSHGGLQGNKEWITEVNVLGVVDHPNLVKLVGYCAEHDETISGTRHLLVYEFMPNGSVADQLFTSSKPPLSWTTRLKVAQDTARGLAYLHKEMDFQIIFRDLKSSNILLDDQWNAKISDFGLARRGPEKGFSHVSTEVLGTMGHVAPEYIKTGHLTSKSDVWSYGVFLFELITGRRPAEIYRPKNEQNLLEWVRPYLRSEGFELIIDPRLEGNYSLKSVKRLSSIATRCIRRDPKSRSMMSEVLEMVNQLISGLVSVVTIEPKMVFTHVKTTHEDIKNEGEKGCSEVQRRKSSCFSRICCLS